MTIETRGGFKTAFARYGKGSRRALFLHCSLASHRAWMPVLERLDDMIDATAIDLPGHGRSAAWSEADGDLFDLTTRVARTFLDDGPIDVIGHSFGGAVALRLAVEEPDLVRRMVLFEPVFFAAARGTPAHAANRERFAPVYAALDAGDPEEATRRFTDGWGGETDFDNLAPAQQRAMVDRIHLISASKAGIEDDNAGLLQPGRLEAAKAPTLFLRGERAQSVLAEIHARLAERMPDARELVVSGAGHMGPLSHPDEIAKLIREHLH